MEGIRDKWDGMERLLASYSLLELFNVAKEDPSPIVKNEIDLRLRLLYESTGAKYTNWDTHASSRAKPRRVVTPEEASGKVYFPVELDPVSRHQVVRDLGEDTVREVLILHLYRYLDFTVKLEHLAVNPVLLTICHGKSGFELPEEMLFDGFKIYEDEAHHAWFSLDLRLQVERETGVVPSKLGAPQFLTRLQHLRESVSDELKDVADLFFVVVSETLISALLSGIPSNESVVTAVRAVVRDHSVDEGRHHIYFAKLLEFVWPQLRPHERAAIGPLIPQFILAFLAPDESAIEAELGRYDLQPDAVQQIIDESYPKDQVLADAKVAARASINHFERVGVMADPRTAEAFRKSGLID